MERLDLRAAKQIQGTKVLPKKGYSNNQDLLLKKKKQSRFENHGTDEQDTRNQVINLPLLSHRRKAHILASLLLILAHDKFLSGERSSNQVN